MRLSVTQEQMDVLQAVTEANFERRLAEHLRQDYPDSIVKLPDGGEFTVETLMADTLDVLTRAGIVRARSYELVVESSIASFVALMFHVAPNFDEHRLCSVLLGDEEMPPDERVKEIPKVLSENNWAAIRDSYDPNAWNPRPEEESPADIVERSELVDEVKAETALPSPVNFSHTIGAVTRFPKSRPAVPEAPQDHLETIRNIDINE